MRFAALIICLAAGLGLADAYAAPLIDLACDDLNGVTHHPLKPTNTASVMVFYWQDCPISNGYAPELNRLAASYTNFSFYLIQIDRDLTPAAAREHARKFDLRPPVLLDPLHHLVKHLHATVSPEVVIVGRNGDIPYRGRIDNRHVAIGKKRATVTERDLIDALDALAAGKPPKQKQTRPVGCLIQ